MTPKNVYIDKLDDIANKYNNTYHSTIKMKPVGVKWNTYIDSCKKINDKNPKFKIGDTVRLSKYRIFLQKITLHIFLKNFCLKKWKILYRGHMLLMILMKKKLLEHFMNTNSKKPIKNSLELKR